MHRSFFQAFLMIAGAYFFIALLAFCHEARYDNQQRQIDQISRMVSALAKENPPTDKEYGWYRNKWEKRFYFALSSGKYHLVFANYPEGEAFVIYYPTGMAGPGCNLEYFFLEGVPKSKLDEWVNKPCFTINEEK